MIIGFYSTDWSSEPVPDPEHSQITGKQEFIPNKQALTFGGTFLQRGAMPAMELARHGYDTFLSWRMTDAPDGHFRMMDTDGNWRDPDMVWLQRHMAEGMDDAIRKARAAGQIVINDCDDQFWALPKSNVAHDTTDPKANPTFNRDHYRKAIGASSAITVSTDAIRKELEPLGPPVYVLRNVIDLERWQPHDPGFGVPVVGWVGGVQWRAADLLTLKSVLPDFLEDYGWSFYHGGDSQVPGVAKAWDQAGVTPSGPAGFLGVPRVMTAPLVHIAQYPKLWNPLSVVLVPLERCRFNEAKSFLKSLEACACGLPYIVSDGLPEQRILIDEGSAGRLARNEKPVTWRRHLEALLDPEVRRAEGRQNRAIAEKHDIHDRWVDWARVYDSVSA